MVLIQCMSVIVSMVIVLFRYPVVLHSHVYTVTVDSVHMYILHIAKKLLVCVTVGL